MGDAGSRIRTWSAIHHRHCEDCETDRNPPRQPWAGHGEDKENGKQGEPRPGGQLQRAHCDEGQNARARAENVERVGIERGELPEQFGGALGNAGEDQRHHRETENEKEIVKVVRLERDKGEVKIPSHIVVPDLEAGNDRMLVGDEQDQRRRTGKGALEHRGRKGILQSVMKNKADAHPDEDGKQDVFRGSIPYRRAFCPNNRPPHFSP